MNSFGTSTGNLLPAGGFP